MSSIIRVIPLLIGLILTPPGNRVDRIDAGGDMLEELGVVGEPVGGGRARKVLIPKGEDPFKRIIDKRIKEKMRKQKRMDGFYDE